MKIIETDKNYTMETFMEKWIDPKWDENIKDQFEVNLASCIYNELKKSDKMKAKIYISGHRKDIKN